MMKAEPQQISRDSIQVKLTFPPGTVSSSKDNLFFKPRVLMQDEDGSFPTSVPSAEKRIPFDKATSTTTVSGLKPGRRYLIRLDPVNGASQPATGAQQNFKALFSSYTSCSCNNEETGKPTNLAVDQSGGEIPLSFKDVSVCEGEQQTFHESALCQYCLISNGMLFCL